MKTTMRTFTTGATVLLIGATLLGGCSNLNHRENRALTGGAIGAAGGAAGGGGGGVPAGCWG